MVRLHAGNRADRGKPRQIRRRDVLRVLDAKARVRRMLLLPHPVEDVQLQPDGPVANGVDHHLEPGARGVAGPAVQVFRRIHQEPVSFGASV